MNFFEHQDKARNQTRKLVFLFALAVIGIIAAVNLLLLGLFTYANTEAVATRPDILSRDFLVSHLDVVLLISLGTGGLIGIASLVRSMKLRSGGSVVARELGGTPVTPDTNDPLKRRLRNVVEEIAIASGVPVPDIYVMENETGINAFAAGYSTSDAAIAVTRGTLETLSRDELQGVIAHEFAHVHNGDMRLNIRLIGILFGILALTIVGRIIMHSARGSRRNGGAIVFVGLAIMLIGYIGVFFGRWIKAAVSRQREYMADASAVQFTRQPQGIGGALKKIAASQHGARMEADTEEVGHMLFASGLASRMMATHPPIMDRIQAVDPSFRPEELQKVREEMTRHAQAKQAEAEAEQAAKEDKPERPRGIGGHMLDPDTLIERMGQPGLGQILAAALLSEALPRPMEKAAHSEEWAMELVCALLVADDPTVKPKQLAMIAEHLGTESERQVRTLLEAGRELQPEQRLPLLEMAWPGIRHRPAKELDTLLALVEALIHADGQVDVFEYAMGRLLRTLVQDVRHPDQARPSGRKTLRHCVPQVNDLIRILAHHGHDDDEAAVAALTAGMKTLELAPAETHALRDDWPERLDAALAKLDQLKMKDKGRLLRALVTTVRHAGETTATEAELLRTIAACLHMPLPLMNEE